MKNFLQNLKTSDKIVFLFSLFNFVGLLILLFAINIIYFFLWYSDQKQESWYDMNINYNKILKTDTFDRNDENIITEKRHINQDKNIEAFKKYILQKDTLIIPNNGGELICSNGVSKKNHNNIEKIKDNFFYNDGGKIFFIYTKVYPEIGEVKVLFDTTSYVKSQIIIIKISLFVILFSLFIFYFLGKKITKYSFRNLEKIAKKAESLDIEKDFKKLKIIGNKQDEINILASTINDSFCHIKQQTTNLKQFITDVSHEFKTPLMVINSQIDLYNKKLEKNKLSEKDTENLLENIKEKTKKLDNLLETFLLLSRVENSIEKLDKIKINFSNYLENFSREYIENSEIIKSIGKENIEVKYKINKNIFLNIEQNTFNLLFGNLISNAIKFSKNKKVSTEGFNPLIKLEIGLNKKSFYIIDNGIGIKKEDLKNIGVYLNENKAINLLYFFGIFCILILIFNKKIMQTLEYLRDFTIFDYAIFDLIVSFGGIYLLSPILTKLFLKIGIEIKRKNWMFLVLPSGILFHIIFGNITPMTRDFLDLNDFYFLKILIIVLLIFGLKDIKIIKK